ncbi:ribosomal protein S7 domain-containing protein [Chaetomium sp. MPI-SDFR-AT-0129]|nr:ribosomal protein S7 domain-containing protein [Chaetomium sp. MPI-SDFR-AT-0129]
MPPRLNLWSACRALTTRTHTFAPRLLVRPATQTRGWADKATSGFPPSGSGAPPPLPPNDAGNQQPAFTSPENEEALTQLRMIEYGVTSLDPAVDGHKYGMPDRFIPPAKQVKKRYDSVVAQVTRLMMQDGKLAKAQRDMAMILNYLRTSPPPRLDPSRPLLPGSPPPNHLPLDPTLYLTLAIDSVAPLVRIRGYKGMAGGGRSFDVPMPLELRQRRRTAFKWILDVARKKQSRGSGRTMFPHRVAEEIVSVVEGRSSVWDKRLLAHKLGTANRANLIQAQRKKLI